MWSRDTLLFVVTARGDGNWRIDIRYIKGDSDFSALDIAKTGFWFQTASYSMSTESVFPGDKAAGAYSLALSLI
jgi:hypothetical protein